MLNNVYESDIFERLPDSSMHPGGLSLTARAARLAGLTPGMLVADIGCGSGATAFFLSETLRLRAVGLDISEKLIVRGLCSHPGMKLVRWDCSTLPFENGCLDAVFLECALSAIGRPGDVIRQCARALKPSGAIIVSDVASREGAKRRKKAPPTPTELEGMLMEAGFRVDAREDHTPALMSYANEIAELGGTGLLDSLLRHSGAGHAARLSDFAYVLLIGRKI